MQNYYNSYFKKQKYCWYKNEWDQQLANTEIKLNFKIQGIF